MVTLQCAVHFIAVCTSVVLFVVKIVRKQCNGLEFYPQVEHAYAQLKVQSHSSHAVHFALSIFKKFEP